MIYTGLVWSHIAQTIPGWFWAGNAPRRRPQCLDHGIRQGPARQVTPSPPSPASHCWPRQAAETAAPRPPFLTAGCAPRYQHWAAGRDSDREPARVTKTAGAQGEPMFSARPSPAYRRPASEAPRAATAGRPDASACSANPHRPVRARAAPPGWAWRTRPRRAGYRSQAGPRGIAWPSLGRWAEARCRPAGRGVGLRAAAGPPAGGRRKSRLRAEDIHRLLCHRGRQLSLEGAPAWPGL